MRAFICAGTLLLALAACTAPQGNQAAIPPRASPAGMAEGPVSAPIFATELAGPATFLPPLPTAVVILKPDDMERNRAFCQAAMALPTVKQAEAASVVAPNLIRTRWLVQIGDVAASHAQDCDYLVGTYDYARAARLMSAVRTSEGGFMGRGPFLLMIIPDRTGMHVAGLNGSGYGSDDMGRFISTWNEALAQSQARITATPDRPGLIRSIFDLVGAVLTTVTGGAGGLIEGVFAGL
jgi:hypothetical protein